MSTKQVVAQTIVFDYEYDEQGVPLNNARVEVRLAPTPQPINQAPLVSLNPKIVSVQTDPNGYWQVSLAPNSGITPANTYYTVKVAQRTPYLMNVPAGGGPVQATSNLINQPSALSANVTNLTGPLTVAGLLTAQAGLTVAGGAVVSSGDLTIAARLVMTAAASKIVPGATSLSLRNSADTADNLLLTDAGLATLRNALSVAPSAGAAIAPSSYGSVPVKLAEVALGVAAATITFSSIPGAFRNLALEYVGRSAQAAALTEVLLTLNGDVGLNYAFQRLISNATTLTALESGVTAQGFGRGFYVTANTSPANIPGIGRIWIPLYSGTTFAKLFRVDFHVWTTATFPASGQMATEITDLFWNNTAAITSIALAPSGGNWMAGSTFTLFGEP